MSWNWRDEKEQKQYELKGTVTISTEEYRDLISDVYELQAKGQKEHDDWYKEYQRANELEKTNKALNEKVNMFKEFLSNNATVNEDYNNFVMRKRADEYNDEI